MGLQSSFRRTVQEFAFRSTGEVKTLKQASGHAETAELSLEAGEVPSGGELPDCRLEPIIGDWGGLGTSSLSPADKSKNIPGARPAVLRGLQPFASSCL